MLKKVKLKIKYQLDNEKSTQLKKSGEDFTANSTKYKDSKIFLWTTATNKFVNQNEEGK